MKKSLTYIIFLFCCCFSSQLTAESLLPPGDSTILYNGCSGDGYEVLVAGSTIYDEDNPSGTETIVGGSASGADSVITVNLVFNPTPTPTISITETSGIADNDGIICQGDLAILDAGNHVAYLWADGSTNQTIGAVNSGDYTVTITDGNGCQATATASIISNPLPTPTIIITETSGIADNDGIICQGDPAVLDVGNHLAYLWADGSTNQTITVANSGDYTVTITDGNGCQATATASIISNPLPTPTIIITETSGIAVDDGIICDGHNATLDAGNNAAYYLWNTGETTQTITTAAPGVYSVTIPDENDCIGVDDVTITANPLPTPTIIITETSGIADNDGIICEGDVAVLDAGAYSSYLWVDGSTNQTITVANQGDYTVMVTDGNGCQATATASITINTAPTITIIETSGIADNDGIICDGHNATLDAGNHESYLWSTGEITQTITIAASGTYTVTITDANGCGEVVDDATITLNPLPTPTIIITETSGAVDNDGIICLYDEATLSTETTYQSYIWSDGNVSLQTTATTPGDYVVFITDFNGCNASATATIASENAFGEEFWEGCIDSGYSVIVNGNQYDEANPSGTEAIDTGSGCDSIVTIDLIYHPTSFFDEIYIGCQDDGYTTTVNGTIYDESNPIGTEVMSNSFGCDSTVYIYLSFGSPSTGTEFYEGCEGDGYEVFINGNYYDESNPFGTETLTNYLGCDSIVTIDLRYYPNSVGSETYIGCQGDGYEVNINGTIYNEANPIGSTTIPGGNWLGCDSTVTIDLVFMAPTNGISLYYGCQGDGYEVNINGTIYNEANPIGSTTIPGGNWLGCDSSVLVDLIFSSPSSGTESYTGQEGDGYEVNVNGTIYNENTPTGTEILTDQFGCDSIVTINLTFYPPTTELINYQGCSGDGYSVVANGVTYDESNPSGTEVILGGSYLGTDSTIIVDLVFTFLEVTLETDVWELNCEAPAAILSPILSGLPDSPVYLWSTAANTETITVTEAGDYILTVSEATGCTATSIITIIESAPTDCVFPGDANYDFVVNSLDHLTVCLAGGDTGPARTTEGIDFLPHYAIDWNEFVLTDIDKKHLDCDGDGIISYPDLNAVSLNYNSQHDGTNPLRTEGAPSVRLVFDDLYIIDGQNTVVSGSIHLDNPETQEDIINLYGIAFSIEYDKQFIEEGTFSITYLDNGWLGTAAEIAPLYKDFHSQGYMDLAFTRGDQVAVSGSGIIATVQFVIEDNLIGMTDEHVIPMNVNNIYAHDNLANPIVFNGEAEDVNISITSTQDILSEDLIDVYPNPVSNELIIDMNDLNGESYQLYNTVGQLIVENIIQDEITSLDVKDLSPGLYILNVKAEEGSINVKIIVE